MKDTVFVIALLFLLYCLLKKKAPVVNAGASSGSGSSGSSGSSSSGTSSSSSGGSSANPDAGNVKIDLVKPSKLQSEVVLKDLGLEKGSLTSDLQKSGLKNLSTIPGGTGIAPVVIDQPRTKAFSQFKKRNLSL